MPLAAMQAALIVVCASAAGMFDRMGIIGSR